MGMLRSGSIILLVALTGCNVEREGWTRVVEIGEGDDQFYSIVHFDPITDRCVGVNLRDQPATFPQAAEFDVQVKGADLVVWAANGWDMPWQGCTNGYIYTGDASASGKIKFGNFINSVQSDAPCSISFDLTVQNFEGTTYEISERDFPILVVGCPRPGIYASEYTDLTAAYGVHNGVPNLVISSWDLEREVCVWARFLASDDVNVDSSAVDVVSPWAYTGLRFGVTERDACVASELIVPPISLPYLSDSAPPMNSTGSVAFATSQTQDVLGSPLSLPCTLDVQLSLQSLGRYHWTPDDVSMHGSGFAVEGACD